MSHSGADLFPSLRDGRAPFIIAEMANAHEARLDDARAIVEAAAQAGADAIKFQKFTAGGLTVASHPKFAHFGRLEMADESWAELIALARDRGLWVLADVFDLSSAALMHTLGIDGFKIHSSDTIHDALLRMVAGFGRTVFLSCGGTRQIEILDAVRLVRASGNDRLVLLHGFQSYPTRVEDANLRRIAALAKQFGCAVGYADHVAGDSAWAFTVPAMALAGGATIIEKHITIDRGRKGLDYYSSLEPAEFGRFVRHVRDAWTALGSAPYEIGAAEVKYQREMKKSLVAAVDLAAGTPIEERMVTYKRAATEAHPLTCAEVAGRELLTGVAADTVLTLDRFNVKVMALVAVRLFSKRLPRKALLPLAGRPAIEHLIDRLRLTRRPHGIVLCTSTAAEDDPLEEIAERLGLPCFRGSEDDVMQRFLDAAARESADVIVRVTGDDMLIDPHWLDAAVGFHLSHNAEYTAYPGLPKGMETEVISVAALRRAHELAEAPEYSEYLTYYMRRPDVFRVCTMPVDERYCRPYRLTLDTPADYEVLQAVFDRLYQPGGVFTTEQVIELLDRHPELRTVNARAGERAVTIDTPGINTELRIEV